MLKEKFSKTSVSVSHPYFERDVFEGIKRYTLLAQDGTQAVYLVTLETTKKVKGLVHTTGSVYASCDVHKLIEVLTNEGKDKTKIIKGS